DDRHRPDLRVLEAQALHRVLELDINAQVVRVQLQDVPGPERLVLLDVPDDAGHLTLNLQPPVHVPVGCRLEPDGCRRRGRVLFGHHFAAIAGAGPLIGPVLAAQFGWAPGILWLLVGVVLGGAVHDFTILTASMRRNGKSLAEIARTEVNPLAGFTAMLAILFIIVIALAGLGL